MRHKSTSALPIPPLTTKAYHDMTINAPITATPLPAGRRHHARRRAGAGRLLLEGNERRDTLSAFNVLQARAGIDLDATPATARAVRELFDCCGPPASASATSATPTSAR